MSNELHNRLIQIISLQASLRATYSASVEESATKLCFRQLQNTGHSGSICNHYWIFCPFYLHPSLHRRTHSKLALNSLNLNVILNLLFLLCILSGKKPFELKWNQRLIYPVLSLGKGIPINLLYNSLLGKYCLYSIL